jgi:peroxiredoxin (alkyl hydroperoxide reductase subunit C)
MAEEKAVGCGRPTGAVVGEEPEPSGGQASPGTGEQGSAYRIMVGRKAPDFVAPAYRNGAFEPVRLSDFLGKWVLLCFYPGDFTFV